MSTGETVAVKVLCTNSRQGEQEFLTEKKQNIVMIGDGRDATIISSNLSHVGNKLKTNDTTPFCVKGPRFIAKRISFLNTAGPKNLQAVAPMSSSDFSVFYQCGFFGYQDTLYAHSGRQFYKECIIRGTVDFIFGYATAVFQDCTRLSIAGSGSFVIANATQELSYLEIAKFS